MKIHLHENYQKGPRCGDKKATLYEGTTDPSKVTCRKCINESQRRTLSGMIQAREVRKKEQ